MALEIPRQGETATVNFILKDETDAVIPRASLTALNLTFKDKRTSQSNAMRLGKDDYVDCGSDNSLKIVSDITMEAWINLQASIFLDSTTDWDIFSSATFLASGFLFGIDGATGKLIYETNQSGATQLSQSSGSLAKNNWYHVVVTRSGTSAIFYINGLVSSREIIGLHINPVAATVSFKIGSTANLSLDGFIRDARIYNRILTASEILNRYQNNVDIQVGLISEWFLRQDFRDSKGSNHGTPTGTSPFRNFGLINGRYNQDVRDIGGGAVNQHTMGETDGKLTWSMLAADNPIINPDLAMGDIELHEAEYVWQTGSGATLKTGKTIVPIWIRKSLI